MRKQIRIVAAALCAGLLLGAVTTAKAASVGAHFAGRDPGFALDADALAGVVAQPFWNNIPGEPFSATSLPLVANTGEFTDVKLVYAANDSWHSDGPSVTANDKLMKGIQKMNPDPDLAPNPGTDTMSFTITNLPAGTFNVLVYLANNGLGGEVSVNVGATTYYVSEQAVFSGTFTRATDITGLYPFGANYAQFDAVPSVGGAIVVTVIKNIVDPQVADGGGVAGIQFVQLTGSPLPVNTQACAITNQPSSVTNVEPNAATFSVATTGPARFQWQKNGVDIPGAVNPSYTTPPTALADSGATFRAIVYNNINTNTSTAATLTVVTNTVSVAITAQPASTLAVEGNRATFTVAATGGTGNGTPRFQWQKNTVDISGATNASYTTPPTVLADNGALFRARVSNNVNSINSADAVLTVVALTPPVQIQGFLTLERWDNIGGNTGTAGQDDLKAAIAAGSPTTIFYVKGATMNDQGIDNYGAKMSGWVVPTVSGDYDFFIKSDDSSALFLNPINNGSGTNALPDYTDPINAICYENGCCNGYPEPGIGTQSTATPIPLVAGRLYGIVALVKEGGGGDNLHVAWRLTTDTTPSASLTDIPPANCVISATTAGQTIAITSPSAVVVSAGKPATFTVSATTAPTADMYSAQWLSNGVPIPGATALSYTIQSVTLAQTGESYSARLYTLLGVTNSAAATLTVTSDNIPPAVLGSSAFPGSTKVGVKFDEALDPVSGSLAANYKVNGVTVLAAQVRTNVANELINEKNLVQLTVATPLNAVFTVTVTNVKDAFGNTLLNSTSPGTLITLTSTDVGSTGADLGAPDPQLPTTVTTYGPGDFDVLTTGSNDIYNNADGMSFLWAAKTNSFDVRVRVISVSPIDNWTAGAIMMREGPVTPNGGGWELARHYFCKVDYGGPGAVPVLDNAANDGADSYEYNARLAPGDPTLRETSNNGSGGSRGWGGTGPGNPSPVPFPDAWIRIARVKSGTSDHLLGYSGTDGVNWSLRQDVDLNDATHAGFTNDLTTLPAGPWPDVCYVGLASVSHTGIGNGNPENTGVVGEYWYSPLNSPYSAYIIYRDYGDTPSATVPTISETRNANGTITIVFTGVLYSSDTANGTYIPVPSATSPFVVNPTTSGKTAVFYKAGP